MNEHGSQILRPGVPPLDCCARAHLVVYGNPEKNGVGPVLRDLHEWATARGHQVSVENDLSTIAREVGPDAVADFHFFDGASPIDSLVRPGQPTLLLTLGGDGTLLHALHRFWPLHVPVLGVSLGTLSFNAAVTPADLAATLDDWLQGRVQVGDRMLLRATCHREGEVIRAAVALNDVVMGKQENLRMIHLTLRQGNELVSTFAGDGLIVSTPTGSTAYNLSAGGPIIFPTMRVLVATAICPHTLGVRSVVLNPDPPLVMEYVPRQAGVMATLAIDGQIEWTLQADDTIMIEADETPLRMVMRHDHSYFQRLRRKLSWSESFD